MGLIAAEVAGVCALVILCRRRVAGGPRVTTQPPVEPVGDARVPRWLYLAAVVTCVCAAIRLLYVLGLSPHGGWDAFAIWTVRARFLFRAGADWAVAFDPHIVHADYPLLLPGLILRTWQYAGRELSFTPALIAVAFGVATVALVGGVLRSVRPGPAAWVGTLALLLPPFVVAHTATQTADVPMGLYLVATVAALFDYDRGAPGRPQPLVLAGCMAACAAWTKNEGVLFLGAIVVGRLGALAGAGRLRSAGYQLAWCAVGSLPVLAVLAVFKLRYAPPNDIVTFETVRHAVTHLTTLARYRDLADGVGDYASSVDRSLLLGVPLLVVYAITQRRAHPRVAREPALATAACALAIMLCGYLAVYVAFSGNVFVHVQTSLDRLLLQLWPAAILTFFAWAEPDARTSSLAGASDTPAR